MTTTQKVEVGQRWRSLITGTVWLILGTKGIEARVVRVDDQGKCSSEPRWWRLSTFTEPWLHLLTTDGTPAA